MNDQINLNLMKTSVIIDSFKTHSSFISYQENREIDISELDFCLLINVRQIASQSLFNSRFLELRQVFEESKVDILVFK
ncbi:MAG: hypothetical protein ACFFEO_13030 [Candidatus Thorarchaeota archaeon]